MHGSHIEFLPWILIATYYNAWRIAVDEQQWHIWGPRAKQMFLQRQIE